LAVLVSRLRRVIALVPLSDVSAYWLVAGVWLVKVSSDESGCGRTLE
jgi:hypothetical protein